ncbi:DUF5615 family PIN-like protein [Herpetosiphon llansteffanensis]|uniref:DUF5615 family PIN-like protein n=1 Tax=Herpetosiphon llansteffanensis TaxID=2094568 RepID=UPI000D7C15A5|nr:DUF5615 family PIN-like protein [Herpetosiphon llansteffanensis]
MSIRYLVDEHISARLTPALFRLNPAIEIVRIAEHSQFVAGLSDQQILHLSQQAQVLFVTQATSIFRHAAALCAQGQQHCGILVVRPLTPIRIIASALYEIWYCTKLTDWQNLIEWIPLTPEL